MEVVIPLALIAAACVAGNRADSTTTKKEGFHIPTTTTTTDNNTPKPSADMVLYSNSINAQQQLYPGQYDTNDVASTTGYINQTMYYQNPNASKSTILPLVYKEMSNQQQQQGTTLEHLLSKASQHTQNPTTGTGDGDWILGGPAAAFSDKNPRGQLYNNNATESRLDALTGAGSQYQRKSERAPLSAPQANMSNASTGGQAPNYSDFYQSRVVPVVKQNGVLPFAQERDTPGGFALEMAYRDAGREKTVDELRTENNPRVSYELNGLEGPLKAPVNKPSVIGLVEHNRPDRFWVEGMDRLFTSVAPTVFMQHQGNNAEHVQHPNVDRREETSGFYSGPAASQSVKSAASARVEQFAPSSRIQYTEADTAGLIGVGSAVTTQPYKEETIGMQTGSYESTMAQHTNNRTMILKDPSKSVRFGSGFAHAISAAIAPITDFLRPQRRDELGDNIRMFGNSFGHVKEGAVGPERDAINATMQSRLQSVQPQQEQQPLHSETALSTLTTMPTTLKESLIYTPRQQINNQATMGGGAYVSSNMPVASMTQRDVTTMYRRENEASDPVLSLGGGGAFSAVGGGACIYDSALASAAANKADMDAKEAMRMGQHYNPSSFANNNNNNNNNDNMNSFRMPSGFAPSQYQIPSVEYSAHQSSMNSVAQREMDLAGRGSEARPPVPSVSHGVYLPPNMGSQQQQNHGNQLISGMEKQLAAHLDPTLLNAFRENPYTHPFTAVA